MLLLSGRFLSCFAEDGTFDKTSFVFFVVVVTLCSVTYNINIGNEAVYMALFVDSLSNDD